MSPGRRLYLDNAATSFPKPEPVYRALERFARECGASYGRSAYSLSLEAGRTVFQARSLAAGLLGAADPARVVFTLNATDSIHLALEGLLKPGDVVLRSAVEHNAVARPLQRMAEQGRIELREVACDGRGVLDLDSLARQLPGARLLCLAHASNVCGALQSAAEAAALCREHGALILLDAAQSAGATPLTAEAWGIDLLAASGHKGLLGPTGVGVLVVGPGVTLEPVRPGGTGSRSDSLEQPENLPDRLESGTLNTFGLAGLAAGLEWIESQGGVAALRKREQELTGRLLDGLAAISGLHVQGPADPAAQVAVVSITFDRLAPSDAAYALDRDYGIMTRAGLHCAPLAHRALGTFPQGSLRLAPGPLTTAAEIDYALEALQRLAVGR